MTPFLKDSLGSHTVDPAWFISRIGKGTAEASITHCCGKRHPSQPLWQALIYRIPWDPNATHLLRGKRISVKVPISMHHNYLLACHPQWECKHPDGKNRDLSIHLYPHFSSWRMVQTKFSNYVWWVNKRVEMTIGEEDDGYFTKWNRKLGLNLLFFSSSFFFFF